MASLVHLDSVSIQLGAKSLFEGLRLVVSERDRLGIIGPNGSGKSTLLKLMAGALEPDQGRVIVSGAPRISYVPQIEEFKDGESVLEAVMRKSLKGDGSTVSAEKALSQAGFVDFTQEANALSGGWQKRLSLATALSENPELLLLDEPTNHLDLAGLHWLEGMLQSPTFAWVLISHDRYFLDRTVSRLVEISSLYENGMFESKGGYFRFKDEKERYLEQESKRTSALANKAKRELEWASRSPKARTGKASYRMKEALRLKKELRKAKSREQREQTHTSFQSGDRNTRELVQCIKCSFSYGDKSIVRQLNYTLRNNTCLGLLGENGQGKSTLLKLLGGELSPDQGKVKQVAGLRVVYFDQLRSSIQKWSTLGELLGDGHQNIIYNGKSLHIIGWGKRFGFEPTDHEKAIDNLSGGERARALLSVLVRQEADLLLLDEPTNDLDISMLEALEKMILEFEGAVVLVTHDRFMLDEVCSHFLGYTTDGELEEYASFEQWEAFKNSAAKEKSQLVSGDSPGKKKKEKSPPLKLSYKDQLEYGRIESEIEKAENRLAEVEALVADPKIQSDPEESLRVSRLLGESQKEVERLYSRWEELEELRRAIEERKRASK